MWCRDNKKASSCQRVVKCSVCKHDSHPTSLHFYRMRTDERTGNQQRTACAHSDSAPSHVHAGEEQNITSVCSNICGTEVSGKSCTKIVLVTVSPYSNPNVEKTMYAITDDQSNRSLAKPEFFDAFDENYSEVQYSLSSCAGTINTTGWRSQPNTYLSN